MRHLALGFAPLLLAGCSSQEPLSPAFAGEWASAMFGCGGPRVSLSKSGVSAAGMPIDGLVFTKTEVSGSTAHVVMELSPAVRAAHAVSETSASRPRTAAVDPANIEVVATLIASGNRISPTNVLSRDKKTRQIRAAPRDVLAIVTLVRCDGRAGSGQDGTTMIRDMGMRLDRAGR